MSIPPVGYVLGITGALGLFFKARTRLQLSKAKHPSLRGHSKMARRLAAQVPFYEYDDATIFRAAAAPADVAARRRAGFMRLAALYRARFAETARQTAEVADAIS